MKPYSNFLTAALLLGLVLPVQIAVAQEQSAAEVMERSNSAYYSAGADAKGRLSMELIDPDGGKRVRVMTMLRKNQEDAKSQKYFIYFHEPGRCAPPDLYDLEISREKKTIAGFIFLPSI